MKIIDYAKKHKEEIVVASILIVMTTISFKKGFALGKESGRKKFLEELKIFQELTRRPSTIVIPRKCRQ